MTQPTVVDLFECQARTCEAIKETLRSGRYSVDPVDLLRAVRATVAKYQPWYSLEHLESDLGWLETLGQVKFHAGEVSLA